MDNKYQYDAVDNILDITVVNTLFERLASDYGLFINKQKVSV